MIDMINYEYRNWIVIDRAPTPPSQKSGNAWWLCQCKECGNQKAFNGSEIRSHRIGACKHILKNESPKQIWWLQSSAGGIIKDETNHIYGKLKVIDLAYTKNGQAYWNCQCECGRTTIARGNALRNGQIHSCGCMTSYKEYEIIKILSLVPQISFQKEYSFPDLVDKNRLRFDFAIFQGDSLIGLIEYQGSQHFTSPQKYNQYGLLQIHDQMKVDYCKQKKIPLLILDKSSNLEENIKKWLDDI